MRRPHQCANCKHLDEDIPLRCTAFPDGIPWGIATGYEKHDDPYPGDHGIQFEPKEEE